uniref:Uncharacterized protein n=1 Tax=Hanusia phi TaxID=3032 RepID=A0A7S0HQS4_9CRYP|mmetsp:Transcript_28605/g.64844  ORF Transcript_28605/g.64844 Transcript_28605/m.64844 type:complete len:117 (+) Transcript_28605:331-681(+)|eukprot:764459-Hanusia_phi.AAC.1
MAAIENFLAKGLRNTNTLSMQAVGRDEETVVNVKLPVRMVFLHSCINCRKVRAGGVTLGNLLMKVSSSSSSRRRRSSSNEIVDLKQDNVDLKQDNVDLSEMSPGRRATLRSKRSSI